MTETMQLMATDPALALYRAQNPHSRAVDRWTRYGSSGTVRRAFCVACRARIATCSADWPETVSFRHAIREHLAACPEWARLDASVRP